LRLATYARINDFGMIKLLISRQRWQSHQRNRLHEALEEENYKIAHGATVYDKSGMITDDEVEVRINGKPGLALKIKLILLTFPPSKLSPLRPLDSFLEPR